MDFANWKTIAIDIMTYSVCYQQWMVFTALKYVSALTEATGFISRVYVRRVIIYQSIKL